MEEHDETSHRLSLRSVRARLVYSIVGVFIGLSVAVVFTVHFGNYNCGVWGLTSSIGACLAFSVTVAYVKQVWDANPHRLKTFVFLGIFLQITGIAGFVAYFILAITENQGLIIYRRGYYLTCVWCFITWKWGFGLFLYSRSFHHVLDLTFSELVIQERKGSYASLSENTP